MQVIVGIDIGNTRSKININNKKSFALNNVEILSQDTRLPGLKNLDFAANKVLLSVSSVVDEQDQNTIIATLIKLLRLEEFELKTWTTKEVLRVAKIMAYEELGHLGTDRALKIYHLTQIPSTGTKLCLGCGTAFTVELIEGRILRESLILPGLELQLKSLAERTAKLPRISCNEIVYLLRTNLKFSTCASIINGVILGYLGIIDRLIAAYQPRTIICTGGYAQLIKDHYSSDTELTIIDNLESQILVDLASN